MKKIFILMVVFSFALLITSCGSSAAVKPADAPKDARIQVYKIQASADPAPAWINKKWEEAKVDGKRVMYFTTVGEKPTKEKAEIEAESKKVAQLATMIKEVASREFAVAKAGMLNDTSELDVYFEETIASVSKNVNISGAMNVEDYWEYLQEVQDKQEIRRYYRFYKRYMMDYDTYQKARKQAFETTAKQVPPELKDKAQNLIKKMDE